MFVCLVLQNDIWPAQSWSSVERSGQWKLLHHFMRKVYEPLTVSPFYFKGDIVVYVVLDQPGATVSYSLTVQVISWAKVSMEGGQSGLPCGTWVAESPGLVLTPNERILA